MAYVYIILEEEFVSLQELSISLFFFIFFFWCIACRKMIVSNTLYSNPTTKPKKKKHLIGFILYETNSLYVKFNFF